MWTCTSTHCSLPSFRKGKTPEKWTKQAKTLKGRKNPRKSKNKQKKSTPEKENKNTGEK